MPKNKLPFDPKKEFFFVGCDWNGRRRFWLPKENRWSVSDDDIDRHPFATPSLPLASRFFYESIPAAPDGWEVQLFKVTRSAGATPIRPIGDLRR
jgi:hypothetical protein